MKNIIVLIVGILVSIFSYSQSNKATLKLHPNTLANSNKDLFTGNWIPNCPIYQLQLQVEVPWVYPDQYNKYKLTLIKDGSNYECVNNNWPAPNQTNTHTFNIPWEDATYEIEIVGAGSIYGSGCNSTLVNQIYKWPGTNSPVPQSITIDIQDANLDAKVNGLSSGFPIKEVCSPSNLNLTKGSTNCEDRYRLHIYQSNANGDELTTLASTSWILNQLPSTVNLSNFYSFTPNAYYKISVEAGMPYVREDFFIHYKKTLNPTITTSVNPVLCDGESIGIQLNDGPSIWNWVSNVGSMPSANPSTFIPTNSGTVNISTTETCVNLPSVLNITVNQLPNITLNHNPSAFCWNVVGPNPPNQQFTGLASPSGGTGVWSPASLISPSGLFDANSVQNPSTFQVTYTYTDLNGCTNSKNFDFGYYDESTVSGTATDITCNGDNDGQLQLTGQGYPPFNYYVNGSLIAGSSLTGQSAGNYQVEVVDANGCVSSDINLNISEPSIVTASLEDPYSNIPLQGQYTLDCFGQGNAIIGVVANGGNGGYEYNFGSGFTVSSTGVMSPQPGIQQVIQVRDQNGCEPATQPSIEILEPSEIIVTTQDGSTPCLGSVNGSVSVSVLGGIPPYSYAWSNGLGSNAQISGLGVGVYSVSVTDANGCVRVGTAEVINTNPGFTVPVTSNVLNQSCIGTEDGSISLTATGGGPYNWDWSNGQSTLGSNASSITDLTAGNYTVTITDLGGQGCQDIQSFTIANAVNSQWALASENSTGIETIDIETDEEGGVYILANYIDANFLNGAVNINSGQAASGFFVVKYDACGIFKWVSSSSNSSSPNSLTLEAIDLEVQGNDLVILVRNSNGAAFIGNSIESKNEGGVSISSSSISASSFYDYYIIKLMSSGSIIATEDLGANTSDYDFKTIEIGDFSSDQFYLGGRDIQNNDGIVTEVEFISPNYELVSTNQTSINGSGSSNTVNDIEVTFDNTGSPEFIFATGEFNSADPAGTTLPIPQGGVTDAFIAKYNANNLSTGQIAAVASESEFDARGNAITVYRAGSSYKVYTTGNFTRTASNWSLAGMNSQNVFVTAYSFTAPSTLTFNWANQGDYTNGLQEANGTGIKVSEDGTSTHVSGTFVGTNMGMQNGGGSTQAQGPGMREGFVAGLDQFGSPIYVEAMGSGLDVSHVGIAVHKKLGFSAGDYQEELYFSNAMHGPLAHMLPGVTEVYGTRFDLDGNGFGKTNTISGTNEKEENEVFENKLASSAIQLYPNPADGLVNITFTGFDSEVVTISFFTIEGRELLNQSSFNTDQQLYQMDVSGLSRGMYIVHISGQKLSETKHLVIK
jgi:hypothetical protein